MNDVPDIETCAACDGLDHVYRFTLRGHGPFCQDCWEALNDPDQALATEERLAGAETEISRLRDLLSRAASVLAGHTGEESEVVKELRKEAE